MTAAWLSNSSLPRYRNIRKKKKIYTNNEINIKIIQTLNVYYLK